MKQDVVIDYAYPLMMSERATKKAHDHFLHGDYDSGMIAIEDAIAQLRATKVAALHMKEQQNALRQQAASV